MFHSDQSPQSVGLQSKATRFAGVISSLLRLRRLSAGSCPMEQWEHRLLAVSLRSNPQPQGLLCTHWLRHGPFVYFIHLSSGGAAEHVEVPARKVKQIASLKGVQLTGIYGFRFGLTPDDLPLTLKDADSEEIVSKKWHEL